MKMFGRKKPLCYEQHNNQELRCHSCRHRNNCKSDTQKKITRIATTTQTPTQAQLLERSIMSWRPKTKGDD